MFMAVGDRGILGLDVEPKYAERIRELEEALQIRGGEVKEEEAEPVVYGLLRSEWMECYQEQSNALRVKYWSSINGNNSVELHTVLKAMDGLLEGLKAYKIEDGNIILFRPEENGKRLRLGAERMCMPSPSVDQFVEAIKETVLANERWIPPPGKGSLYIRPLLMGSGSVLSLAPAPEFTFLIYASHVGNYFKEGLSPIDLIVETEIHRATPGGTMLQEN